MTKLPTEFGKTADRIRVTLEEGRVGLGYVKFQVPFRLPREDVEQQLNFKSEIPGRCWGKWDIVYSLSSGEGINEEC